MSDFETFGLAVTWIHSFLTTECRFDYDSALGELFQLRDDVQAAVERGDCMLLHWDGAQLRPYFGNNDHMCRLVNFKLPRKDGDMILAIHVRDGAVTPVTMRHGLH